MSQPRKETIECPHCHKEGVFEYWALVNVDLAPELREKVFSDELFMYHCPHCGEVMGIAAGTIYLDIRHKFVLFFEFNKPDGYDYAPMELPGTLDMYKGYTLRAVFGLQRFKEKIVILERGLDDVVIERQKYMISHISKPEIARKGYELFFEKKEEPDGEFPCGKIFFSYNDEEKQQTIELGLAMDNYYEHSLACKLDPRMKAKGCMCVDDGWMARQMMRE